MNKTTTSSWLLLAATLTVACGGDPEAQAEAASPSANGAGVLSELASDLAVVEEKIVGLAQAMTVDQYTWRPSEGVRSVGEVFMHVAADNYFLPKFAGFDAPAHTAMTTDYQTAVAFEESISDRDAIIAELKASFTHVRDAMQATDASTLEDELEFFGRTTTVRGLWINTVTHLHEHLGQGIAYARSNEVTPPWSR